MSKDTSSKITRINTTYQKAMEKLFDFVVLASKNSKTSKALYNKLFKMPTLSNEDQAYLDSQLAVQKPPKILKTHRGIILIEGSIKTTVQWTEQMGVILVNGKAQPRKQINTIHDIFESPESTKSKLYHALFVPKSYAALFVGPFIAVISNIVRKAIIGAIIGNIISNATPLVNRQIEDMDFYLPVVMGSIGAVIGISDEFLSSAPPAVKAKIQTYINRALALGLLAAVLIFYYDNSFKDGYELRCENDGVYKLQKLENKAVVGTIYKYDGQYLIIGAPGTDENYPSNKIQFRDDKTIDGESGFIGKTLFIKDPNKQTSNNHDLVEYFYELLKLQTLVPTDSDQEGKELVDQFLKEHKERFETCKKNPNKSIPFSKFQSNIGEKIRIYPGKDSVQ